jgi:hypothetical protein
MRPNLDANVPNGRAVVICSNANEANTPALVICPNTNNPLRHLTPAIIAVYIGAPFGALFNTHFLQLSTGH